MYRLLIELLEMKIVVFSGVDIEILYLNNRVNLILSIKSTSVCSEGFKFLSGKTKYKSITNSESFQYRCHFLVSDWIK